MALDVGRTGPGILEVPHRRAVPPWWPNVDSNELGLGLTPPDAGRVSPTWVVGRSEQST